MALVDEVDLADVRDVRHAAAVDRRDDAWDDTLEAPPDIGQSNAH
jgi:hypothetical protein